MTSHMVLPPVEHRLTLADRLSALAAQVLAAGLTRLPFPVLSEVLSTLGGRCQHAATPTQAQIAAEAARWAGHWMPGRAACLENAVAAMLTAAVRGRRVYVCIGARMQPYATHAWIETATGAAGESQHPDRPYHLLLRI
ncbi:lasso peptide biosynthesis B2 protein [Nonomuraea sp. NPDC049646]|uniref:lasso peptide biosynthesis B2 protein n=1 Tax=unclassified Nonomuraea TaxID=2593643 RepID=UPI00378FF83C